LSRFEHYYIFAIPSRYIDLNCDEIPFHGVGGKFDVHEDASYGGALMREIREETGVSANVISSVSTRSIITGMPYSFITVADNPKPYCIYKRIRSANPNFSDEILYVIGCRAVLNVSNIDQLVPRNEVGALVVLTSELLIKSKKEELTYSEIFKSRDGSRLIVSNENDLSRIASKRAIPTGLALIVVSEIRS